MFEDNYTQNQGTVLVFTIMYFLQIQTMKQNGDIMHFVSIYYFVHSVLMTCRMSKIGIKLSVYWKNFTKDHWPATFPGLKLFFPNWLWEEAWQQNKATPSSHLINLSRVVCWLCSLLIRGNGIITVRIPIFRRTPDSRRRLQTGAARGSRTCTSFKFEIVPCKQRWANVLYI